DALFFSGGAWNAGALGMFTSRCLVRVEPGDTPDDPYEIVGFPDDNLADYQIRAASMAPSSNADDGWRLYVLAMGPPAESEYERTLVDFEILYSDDYGDSFISTAKIENKGAYAFANITVAPGWSEDESGVRGMYLSSSSILSTPSGFGRELLPGAWGGNSTMFGSGVTADGIQVSGLSVRDGNSGEWQSSLDMAPHALAVGREHVYFSSWPFSRAPGMMTDGGGLYEVDPADILEHAALGDESIPDLNEVWDPAVHPCTITVPSNPSLNPPPIAHYIAVDPKEEQIFAIMRKAGAGYDYWADPNECGNGLWVAHRPDEPGKPWTWELLIKEESGPVFSYLWVVSDAQGDFRYLIVGLLEKNDDYPNLREQLQQPFLRVFHDGTDWQYEELDVGLPLWVDLTTCRGTGLAYDPVETDHWIATAACGDLVSWKDTYSYIRLSNDAGGSFVPWGEGTYDDRNLGATVLYRYPNGERRLFVHARDQGVMVQTDTQDPGSLTLIQDGLGRLCTTTGASTLNLMWPPPSPIVEIYLPIILNNL
ncbi:MAG: hypothetical protein U9R15_06620, partial [Chloroflexota bacterium]|nr:hypothetical protein [Chloroflexota bacterium]